MGICIGHSKTVNQIGLSALNLRLGSGVICVQLLPSLLVEDELLNMDVTFKLFLSGNKINCDNQNYNRMIQHVVENA